MNIKTKSFYIYLYDNKLDEPIICADIVARVNNALVEMKAVELPDELKKAIDSFVEQETRSRFAI